MIFSLQKPGKWFTCDVISSLLVNSGLHGMETALTKWSLKAYPKVPVATQVRCPDNFTNPGGHRTSSDIVEGNGYDAWDLNCTQIRSK